MKESIAVPCLYQQSILRAGVDRNEAFTVSNLVLLPNARDKHRIVTISAVPKK